MNTDNSKKIYEKAKKSIPGGVNSPVRAFQSVDKEYQFLLKEEEELNFMMKMKMSMWI